MLGGGSLLPYLMELGARTEQSTWKRLLSLFIYLNPNLYSAAKKCHSGGHEAYLRFIRI